MPVRILRWPLMMKRVPITLDFVDAIRLAAADKKACKALTDYAAAYRDHCFSTRRSEKELAAACEVRKSVFPSGVPALAVPLRVGSNNRRSRWMTMPMPRPTASGKKYWTFRPGGECHRTQAGGSRPAPGPGRNGAGEPAAGRLTTAPTSWPWRPRRRTTPRASSWPT